MNSDQRDPGARQSFGGTIWPVLAIVLLISVYPLLRYGGWWNLGGDTLNFTTAIRSLLDTGELVPQGRTIYPNGYGFQALSTFLISLSGVTLPDWQFFGGSFLILWMVIPAWLLYREWVGTNRGALLATLFLFIQPELLFGIMRGTHEKFSRGLILLSLYLITCSLRSRQKPVHFAASVIASYLIIYAIVTFNNFFATSFITSILLSLGMIWFLARWTKSFPSLTPTLQRLGFAFVISLVIVFIYIFYLYSPAQRNLSTLATIADRISALFLWFQPTDPADPYTPFNPYFEPIYRAWISPYVFLILTLANWILLLGTTAIWALQSFRWLTRRQSPSNLSAVLLWAFFGAFVFQGAIAIFADVGGALTGNLQHRIFPAIGLMAAPLLTSQLLSVLQSSRARTTRLVRTTLIAGMGFFSLIALIKATNEPVLSNHWQTYLPAEIRALDWAESALADRTIWTGLDRRLVEVVGIRTGAAPRRAILDRIEPKPGTHNFLVSDLIRFQLSRLGLPLPMEPDDFVTYDNGQVQIYHFRPRTPYQR